MTTTAESNSGYWQLCAFSAVFILSSFVMYGIVGDPCMLIFGESKKCNSGAETFLSRIVAVSLLYVGIFYASLTYTIHTQSEGGIPKMKRLSNMTANCAMALLTSVIFIGPRSQGGVERSWLHLSDLIFCILLVAVLLSPTWDTTSSTMPSPNSPWVGLGTNPKTFLLFIGVILILKSIALSEFMNPLMLLVEIDSGSALSKLLWHWLVVIMLILFYPIVFAVVYGDERDQQVLVGATVVMIAISLISIIPIANMFKAGLMTAGLVGGGIVSLLGIAAIFLGRKSDVRQEYESV